VRAIEVRRAVLVKGTEEMSGNPSCWNEGMKDGGGYLALIQQSVRPGTGQVDETVAQGDECDRDGL